MAKEQLPADFRWKAPAPYNFPAAIDGMGTIGGPLLAGISIALIAVVIASASAIRWVDQTLFLLVVAAAAFVASVEFAFFARQFAVTPSDLEGWWPDHDAPNRRTQLRREQRFYDARFGAWSSRARFAYNVGILALALAVAALLVPRGPLTHAGDWRLAAIALTLAAFLAESCWLVWGLLRPPTMKLPEVGPEKSEKV